MENKGIVTKCKKKKEKNWKILFVRYYIDKSVILIWLAEICWYLNL